MIMSIEILEKRDLLKFSLHLNIHLYIILYLVSCMVTYVIKEKSNTDIFYTIFSKHLIYEFLKVIEELCCCQTTQNTQVLHAMVVPFEKVWSLLEETVDELSSR